MRKLGWIAFLLVVCVGFQDPPQDGAAAVAKAVDAVVYQELTALRVDTRLMVRQAVVGPTEKLNQEDRFIKSLKFIDPDLMKVHLAFLASDELGGRCAGKDSERLAVEYIADQFRRAGLKPAGERGGYVQNFTRRGRTGRNVIGLLEGSDAKLKDEVIVIGGHHDHCGRAEDKHPGGHGGEAAGDTIWNGADDNASGTTTVLSIARAFGAMGVKPKRSILFMTFGAEEFGLVGSEHFVAQPTIPLDKIVAMINLDMVGRNPKDPCGVWGVATADVFDKSLDGAAGAEDLPIKKSPSHRLDRGDSDSTSFYNGGVPVLFFFTGFHDEYHKVTDHAELIAYDRMAMIGRTSARLLWDFGNREDAPRIKKAGKRKLGIRMGELKEEALKELGLGADEGGLMIIEVEKGAAAEKAGLKVDDVILKFGDKGIPRKDASKGLQDAIKASASKAKVEVYREGKRLQFDVDFGD